MFETAPTLSFGVLVAVTIIVASVTITFVKNKSKEYKKIYKDYFTKQVASQIFTDLHYDYDKGIEKKVLDDTGMINTGNRYISNDLMVGKYKNTTFTQADVRIEYRDNEGGYVRKIFNGRFMIFGFPRKFDYSLEVVSNFFKAEKILTSSPETGRKFERFQIESPTFNKKFRIYAEDGFEAFYLMDPTFIEKIEKLSLKYKKRMIMCFIDSNKDSFEPPCPFKKIDEQVEINKNREHLKIITDFIDELFVSNKNSA